MLLANSFKEAPLHLVPPVSETVDSLDRARAVAPSRQGSWRSLLRVEERPPLMMAWSRDPVRRALSLSPARSSSGKCSEQATTNHPTSALRVRAPRLCAKCGWRSQPTGFVHSGRVPPVGIFLSREARASNRPTGFVCPSVRPFVALAKCPHVHRKYMYGEVHNNTPPDKERLFRTNFFFTKTSTGRKAGFRINPAWASGPQLGVVVRSCACGENSLPGALPLCR